MIWIPLQEGSDIAVSVKYSGPLPATPQENTYIVLFSGRFSRRADMLAFTAAEFTAESIVNVIVNRHPPPLGMLEQQYRRTKRPPGLLK